jgi:LPXTG-motif cell wall-anchored protein
MENGRDTRRIAAGVGAMLAGAGLLVAGLPAGVGASPTQQEPTTSSSVVEGNPDCADLGFDFGFRIETPGGQEVPAEGEHTDPESGLVVTITAVAPGAGGDPATISLETSFPISAVLVKSGPGGILYTSEPPTTTWTGLASPNPGISHIELCWNEVDTTTSSSSTTTSSTTTTSSSTTSTVPDSTVTTLVGGVTTTVPGGELPETGNNTTPLLVAGAALLAVGTALVAGTKRLRRQ